METLFLLRFKEQPAAFKKGIKNYGEGGKWYDPTFIVELYEKIVQNESVRGILEVELKCLASSKKIANVRFVIDRNKSLDTLIYNTLIVERERLGLAAPDELEQLIDDFRHVFKWDEKQRNNNVEVKQVSNSVVESCEDSDEKPKYEELTIDAKSLEIGEKTTTEFEDATTVKISAQSSSFKDLSDNKALDESSLMPTVANKVKDENEFNITQSENAPLKSTSLSLITAKIAEIEEMMEKGVDHLIDISQLAGKNDPVSIKKQHFIWTNYKTPFMKLLNEQHQLCTEKKAFLEKETNEQLMLKSQGIKQESKEVIEAELTAFCLDLELKFEEKKKYEMLKLEKQLKLEFDEAVGNERKKIEDKMFSNLTPEQSLQMDTYYQEIEDMIKPDIDAIINDHAACFQIFIDNMYADLQRKQVEFEKEQDRLELKEMQDKLIQIESALNESQNKHFEMILANQEQFQKQMAQMTLPKNDVINEKSFGILAYLIIVAIIFTVGGFFIFQLDFIREALSF